MVERKPKITLEGLFPTNVGAFTNRPLNAKVLMMRKVKSITFLNIFIKKCYLRYRFRIKDYRLESLLFRRRLFYGINQLLYEFENVYKF